MFVKGDIVVASGNNTIVIPKDIIVAKQRGNYVYIVENGLALEKEVKLGLDNTNEVEIISGLKMKDRLVIKGFETLNNKSKVKVVK